MATCYATVSRDFIMATATALFLFCCIFATGHVSAEDMGDQELNVDHVLFSEEYEIEGELDDSVLFKRHASLPIKEPDQLMPFSGTVKASGKVVMVGHFGLSNNLGHGSLIPLSDVTSTSVTEDTTHISSAIFPTTGITCPTCGTTHPITATTCLSCGTTRPTTAATCPSCGTTRPTTAPTCPSCGTTRPTTAPTCPSCGTTRPTTVTCPSCGTTRPTTATCPSCGTTRPTTATCASCGTAYPTSVTTCPACGTTNPISATTCPTCGTRTTHPTSVTTYPTCGTAYQATGITCPQCGTVCQSSGTSCPHCGTEYPTVPFKAIVPATGQVTIAADFKDDGLDQLLFGQNANLAKTHSLKPTPCVVCHSPNKKPSETVHATGRAYTTATFDSSGNMLDYKSVPSTLLPAPSSRIPSVRSVPPVFASSSHKYSSYPYLTPFKPTPCATPKPPSSMSQTGSQSFIVSQNLTPTEVSNSASFAGTKMSELSSKTGKISPKTPQSSTPIILLQTLIFPWDWNSQTPKEKSLQNIEQLKQIRTQEEEKLRTFFPKVQSKPEKTSNMPMYAIPEKPTQSYESMLSQAQITSKMPVSISPEKTQATSTSKTSTFMPKTQQFPIANTIPSSKYTPQSSPNAPLVLTPWGQIVQLTSIPNVILTPSTNFAPLGSYTPPNVKPPVVSNKL